MCGAGSQLRSMVTPSESNTPKESDVGLFGTLANSQLRRFLAATTLWGTGHQLMTVAQGFLLFELTDSTLWLAALGAAVGVPNIIVAILGGILADRIPRKRILMIGATVAGLPMLAISVLLAADALEPWHLLVGGAAQGSALALDWIARLSLLPDVVPKKIMVRSISIDQAAFNGARVIAPLVGGFVLASSGATATYGLIVGFFGLAIITYTTIKPHTEVSRGPHVGIVEDFKEVGRVLRSNVILRVNLMFTAVNALMLGGLVFIIPAFVKDVHGVGETGLGFLFAAVGLGAFAGAFTVFLTGGIRRSGIALLVTDVLFGALVIIWAFTTTMAMALPVAFLLGYFNAVHIALGIAVIQVNVPAEVRGRVIGAYELAWSGFPLGGLVSGSLAAIFGLEYSLTILATVLIVFTIVTTLVSQKFRNISID